MGTRIFGGGGMPAGEDVRDESSCSDEKLVLSCACPCFFSTKFMAAIWLEGVFEELRGIIS